MDWLSVLQGMGKFEDWTAKRAGLKRGGVSVDDKKNAAAEAAAFDRLVPGD